MRKLIVLTAAVLMVAIALPVFSQDFEIGVSWTPVPGKEEEGRIAEEEGMDSIFGFHFGYCWWSIFYASLDSLVMPPPIIQDWTGYYRPGFLNLLDVGVRLFIGPVVGYAELGVNNIYVYKQGEDNLDAAGLGANLRLGLGLKYKMLGVNVSGTSVFPSVSFMLDVLKGLASDQTRNLSLQMIKEGLVPSLNLVLYF